MWMLAAETATGMHAPLTVGDVVYPLVVLAGVVAVVVVIIAILSIFADAWKH